MKSKIIWPIIALIAVICGVCHHFSAIADRRRAVRLGEENGKLARQYFLKLARDEATKAFPDAENDVSASGGSSIGQDHFELLTSTALYFWKSVPVGEVEVLIRKLSGLEEINRWKTDGPSLGLQRDCKFVLAYAGPGNVPTDRPMLEMLFHESNLPQGQIGPNQLAFWERNWKSR